VATLEQVIYQAAQDCEFRQALKVNINQAMTMYGLELGPEETTVLKKVSQSLFEDVVLEAELWPSSLGS
jgi:hypothetical protein